MRRTSHSREVKKTLFKGKVMLPSRFALGASLLFPSVLAMSVAHAQDYPNKPIRIVTSAAGGGTDFVARQIAEGISGPLGQPVVIDNRAIGAIVGEVVSKAPADGYTLMVSGGGLWLAHLFRAVPYDAVRDFSPISLLVREVSVLAVHPSLPVRSVKELIALAKARPGELNYSANAAGTTAHLATELFKSLAGVNVVHVPYKGSAPAVTALLSGEVQVTIFDAGLVMPHANAGRLRALAVTSATPSALTPGLPTVASSGVPGYEAVGMTGTWAPAKTPAAIISRLNQEVNRAVNRGDVKERFFKAGVEVVASTPEQFETAIKSDIAKTDKLIKDGGIKVN